MEKETLQFLIEENLSQRQIAKKLNIGQTTLRYWLIKFELETKKSKFNSKKEDNTKICPKCNEEKKINLFYQGSGYCKECHKKYSIDRLRLTKIKMIEYKGGKCNRCELKVEDSHPAVFEFHHIDPKTKDPNFNRLKSNNMKNIIPELDKCILVCANCHRIIHSEINKKEM